MTHFNFNLNVDVFVGGGDEFEEMFEEESVVPGPLELQCPSCGGLISVTTTQRPIQVGCPMCQSQFVIRE